MLEFFGVLEEPASPLEVTTWGEGGAIELDGEAEPYDWDLIFEDGPRGRQWGDSTFVEGDGVNWFWSVDIAANGRFDVTVEVVEDISAFGIMATWVAADLPPVDDDDDEPDNDRPFEPEGCKARTLAWFTELDADQDGLVSLEEHRPHPDTGTPGVDLDQNADKRLQMAELEADLCSCAQEFLFIWEQADEADAISVEDLGRVVYLNDIELEAIDRDGDGDIDDREAERHTLACSTTYDPLDLDGDGVPNDDDAFPEDPDESQDSDGDGVGDNADLVSGVNDSMVTYGAAAAVLVLVIVLLLTLLRRGPGGAQSVDPWAELGDEKRMPDLLAPATMAPAPMMGPEPITVPETQPAAPAAEVPGMTDLPPPLNEALPSAPLEWQ